MSFPNCTKKEMIKAFLFEMKIPYEKRNYFVFYYFGELLKDDDTHINFIPSFTIKVFKTFIIPEGFYGKMLKVNFEDNVGLSSFLNNKKIYAGSLQKIKDFYMKIKDYINSCNYAYYYIFIENPIIYPGNIELKIDDENTFSSVGIFKIR